MKRRELRKQGFTLVPQILTAGEVAKLRETIDTLLDHSEDRWEYQGGVHLSHLFVNFRELRWLLFHQKLKQTLKAILGNDFVWLREAVTARGHYSQWHKDLDVAEKSGFLFAYERDFALVNVLFYLQDNTPEFGGGLEVVPGTHKQKYPSPFVGNLEDWNIVATPFGKKRRSVYSIPSRAGDLVLVDLRLCHRAAQGTPEGARARPDKFYLSLMASSNNRIVKQFHSYLEWRGGRLDDRELSLGYEKLVNFSYPSDLLKDASTHGVNLA